MSAKTQAALDRMTGNLGRFLEENTDADPADIAYTLQTGRKHFPYRRKLVGSTIEDIRAKLSTGDSRSLQSYRAMEKEGGRKVIFMFPGLGPQYPDMGLGLYRTEPVFREAMDRCFEILKSLGYDLKAALYPSIEENRSNKSYKSNINEFDIAQLAVFIFEYALAKLVMSWGIRPHAMIGYSFGEYAASSARICRYPSTGSVPSSGITSKICTITRVRSMCRKKSCPSPAPSLAPSISPGMSAITSRRSASSSAIPNCGTSVVNG